MTLTGARFLSRVGGVVAIASVALGSAVAGGPVAGQSAEPEADAVVSQSVPDEQDVETAITPRFVGVVPERVLDTREGLGAPRRPVEARGTIDVQISGRAGVPDAGVTAVVLNVTAVAPTAQGFVTVWPFGSPRPDASNLNFTPGKTVPNLVIVKLGDGGKVSLYNHAGNTHLVADVSAYYTAESQIVTSNPRRILDTRTGVGGVSGPTRGTEEVQVAGRGGVPVLGASAVIMNVTVVQPSSTGFFTVYPFGTRRPTASNINVLEGETRPNLVIAKLGEDGKVSYYNNRGNVHVLFDVLGYISAPPNLTELDLFVADRGDWSTGQFSSQGERFFNSVWNQDVVDGGVEWAEYNLGREWSTLSTTFSFDDDRSQSDDQVRFRILGDGVELANETLSFGETVPVSVDVSGVLRMRFEVTGIDGYSARSGFIDPKLSATASAARDVVYAPLAPFRVLDSREGIGAAERQLRPGETIDLKVLGVGGVPESGVGAIAVNFTATNVDRRGFFTAWPKGSTQPLASNLNYVPGRSTANFAVVPVGPNGSISIFNSAGNVDVIADVVGWYRGSADARNSSGVLTELDLFVADRGDWSTGQFSSQGERFFNSVWNQDVVDGGVEWAEYNLGREWSTLSTTFSFDDDRSQSDDQVRFRILGDGVELANSTVSFGETVPVSVDVSGVLRMRFEVTGIDGYSARSGFIDPELSR